MTSKDFDLWRLRYAEMSYRDQQAFGESVTAQYPDQASFDGIQAFTFFNHARGERASVIELGGYDGRLASQMLAMFPDLVSWTNYEMDRTVKPACKDRRYRVTVPDDWAWKQFPPPTASIFVATHTIEHLSVEHVSALFDWVTTGTTTGMYLEAPLPPEPVGELWWGYLGTHMLQAAWSEVTEWLVARGWQVRGGWREGRWLVRSPR